MWRAIVVAIPFSVALSVACSSKSTPVDAKPVDAKPIDAKPIDAPAGGLGFGSDCTTVSDTSTECTSGICTNTFNMFPTPVCSQKCTMLGGTDPTCPVGSMGQKCNMQGYCRP